MQDKVNKYVGDKRITALDEILGTTPTGHKIYQVTFKDGSQEYISELMLEKVATDRSKNPSELRDLRVFPVVQVVLAVLRDWGIKMSELPYFSAVLNQSLDTNHKQALNQLFAAWMPKPRDPEDIDLITIDRILKTIDGAK